jgi:hypothetical protein
MEKTLALPAWPSFAEWRDLVLPKEHGSWSLALEPVAFGLIAATSPAGGCLALAVVAGFFARRPLRIAWREARPERRTNARVALAACASVAALALLAAISVAGTGWLGWLVPSAVAGAIFLGFDLRNAGRAEAAEVIGAAAFAWLPAAFVALDGRSVAAPLAIAVVMSGRAVPTVLTIRAVLRENKTGVRRPRPALVAAALAFAAAAWLARTGDAPWIATVALGLFLARTLALFGFRRFPVRARRIGMVEAALGLAFVLAVAPAFRG